MHSSAFIFNALQLNPANGIHSPEHDLLGHFFGRDWHGGFSVNNERLFPLGFGDVDGTNGTLVGNGQTNSPEVGFLPRKSNAGPGIDAELDHLETVIQKKISEIGGPFPFFLRFDREVKGDHQPAHFVVVRVHGR